MRLPNFLIVGAPKCGTTSIASGLSEHPEIFIAPVKEVSFFNNEEMWSKGLSKYREYFDTDLDIVGEATPFYAGSQDALRRIESSLIDVRMIYAIRNPIERAHSHYSFRFRAGTETRLLSEVIDDELSFPNNNVNYLLEEGFYAHHIINMQKIFGSGRVLVVEYSKLLENPVFELGLMADFLKVTKKTNLNLPRMNSASVPRNSTVARIIKYILTKDSYGKLLLIKLIGRSNCIRLFGMFKRKVSIRKDKVSLSESDFDRLYEIFSASVLELEVHFGQEMFNWSKLKKFGTR